MVVWYVVLMNIIICKLFTIITAMLSYYVQLNVEFVGEYDE